MRKWLLYIIPAPAPLMIAQLTNYRGRDNVVTISILSTIYTVLCDHQYTIYRMLTHWEPKTKPCVHRLSCVVP